MSRRATAAVTAPLSAMPSVEATVGQSSPTMAAAEPVGQACRQRVHVPQWSGVNGESGSSSRPSKTSASRKYDPCWRGDQAGVLADPAQPGALRQVALQQRACIGVPAVGNWAAHIGFDKIDQGAQARGQHFVVIVAPGVSRYPSLFRGERKGVWGVIEYSQYQDGAAFGQDLARVGAPLARALCLQVAHFAMPPGLQPALEDRSMRRRVGRGHSRKRESQARACVFILSFKDIIEVVQSRGKLGFPSRRQNPGKRYCSVCRQLGCRQNKASWLARR